MPNAKLHFKISGAFQQIFPETVVDQLSDATTVGKNLFKKAAPSVISFAKVGTDGSITWRTAAEMLSDLGAAAASHPHVTGDITDLAAALAAKADLSGGVITSTQVPSYVTGGLKFKTSHNANKTINAAFITTEGLGTTLEYWGLYFIVTNTSGIYYEFDSTFAEFDTVGDDEPILQYGTIYRVYVELGDWVVLKKYESGKYKFTVINNTYRTADQNNYGNVRLSSFSTGKRYALDSNVNAYKVVDERTLRNVMKDIWYEDTVAAAANALDGDLLIEY